MLEVFIEQVDPFFFFFGQHIKAISEQPLLQIIELLQQNLVILLDFLVALLDLHQDKGQLVVELFRLHQVNDDLLQLEDSFFLVVGKNGQDYLLCNFTAGFTVVLQVENAVDVNLCREEKRVESIGKGLQLIMNLIVAIDCLVFLLSLLLHFPHRSLQNFHPKHCSTLSDRIITQRRAN